jgi:PAS domain-containing protein
MLRTSRNPGKPRPSWPGSSERAAQSEEQFRILFDRSPDGILVVDARDQHILKANRACGALLGRAGTSWGPESAAGLVEDWVPDGAPAPDSPEDLLARAAAQGASSGLATVSRSDGSSLRSGSAAPRSPGAPPPPSW